LIGFCVSDVVYCNDATSVDRLLCDIDDTEQSAAGFDKTLFDVLSIVTSRADLILEFILSSAIESAIVTNVIKI
jgi:hypothetical protein